MDLKTLRAELQKLAALAEGWDASHEIIDIERDLALGKLRDLYEAVRFGLTPAAEPPQTEGLPPIEVPPVEIDLDAVMPPAAGAEAFAAAESAEGAVGAAAPAEIPVQAPASAGVEVPAGPTVVVEAPAEPTVVPAEEPVVAAAAQGPVEEVPVVSGAAAAAAPAVSVETAAPVSEGPSAATDSPAGDGASLRLFEMAPVDAKRAKHRVVLSLYGETEPVGPVCPAAGPAAAEPLAEEPAAPLSSSVPPLPAPEAAVLAAEVPATDPAAAIAPAVEPVAAAETPSAVLGETLNADVTTVSDLIAAPAPAVGQEPVTDLRRALCNNDRFLLARDLFGGDMAACERTVERLNAFDDLDECMLYIAENFDWNPHSDGAKLLVDLIERKLA